MLPPAKPHYPSEPSLENKWIDLFISCLNFIRGLTYFFAFSSGSSKGICILWSGLGEVKGMTEWTLLMELDGQIPAINVSSCMYLSLLQWQAPSSFLDALTHSFLNQWYLICILLISSFSIFPPVHTGFSLATYFSAWASLADTHHLHQPSKSCLPPRSPDFLPSLRFSHEIKAESDTRHTHCHQIKFIAAACYIACNEGNWRKKNQKTKYQTTVQIYLCDQDKLQA